MLYIVTVVLGDKIFALEQVKGFDAAYDIELYYNQWPEYTVMIEPNVYGYMAERGLGNDNVTARH